MGSILSSWFQLLIVSMLRLNSRDYVRDRSTTDNSYNLSSIRIESSNESKSGQASVTVPRSTILNFSRNKSHHGVEPAFEVPKSVTTFAPACDTQTDTYLFAGCKYHPFPKRRSNVGVGARRVLGCSWRNSGRARQTAFIRSYSLAPLASFIRLFINM